MSFTSITVPAPEVMVRAESRLLQQFRRSLVLMALLEALTSQIQELRNAIADVQNLRGPLEATGAQLDAIGRIVGQTRTLLSYNEAPWFTADSDVLPADSLLVGAWVTDAPLGTDALANDTQFRDLIEARVSRNFIKNASIPEVQAVVKQLFGVDIGFTRTDMMEVSVLVPTGTSSYITEYLDRFFSTDVVEDVVVPPYPATLEISAIIEV